MILRSIVLTLCLALFCLGAVVGCAPPADSAQPSLNAPAPAASPAVTATSSDAPSLGE